MYALYDLTQMCVAVLLGRATMAVVSSFATRLGCEVVYMSSQPGLVKGRRGENNERASWPGCLNPRSQNRIV